MFEDNGSSDRDPLDFEPRTFWITLLAWVCSGVVWWLVTFVHGWWVIAPAIALVCLSFTVALVKDVKAL